LRIFEDIGNAFNSPLSTVELLEVVAESLVQQLELKACHFRLLSRDLKVLEHVAAYGLSETFLSKGPVDAERSVAQALAGKTVMIHDCATDSRIQYPEECRNEGLVSLLTVPVRTRGQVIGVMRLFTGERRDFTPQELEIIDVAANFCASAIVHSMFHDILEHVTQAIRSSLDLQQVLASIARVVSEDLRCRGCTIQLCDSTAEHLELRAAYGLSPSLLDKIRQTPAPQAFQALDGECAAVLEARHETSLPYVEEFVRDGVSSMLYVPLMIRDRPMGVLCVYTHLPYEFSEDEIYLLSSIGEQCALAIRNAQMYQTIKLRYEDVVDEFQQWFEHYCVFPARKEV
jgi:GAF domain-containing protein